MNFKTFAHPFLDKLGRFCGLVRHRWALGLFRAITLLRGWILLWQRGRGEEAAGLLRTQYARVMRIANKRSLNKAIALKTFLQSAQKAIAHQVKKATHRPVFTLRMSWDDFVDQFTDLSINHLINTSLFSFSKTWKEVVMVSTEYVLYKFILYVFQIH